MQEVVSYELVKCLTIEDIRSLVQISLYMNKLWQKLMYLNATWKWNEHFIPNPLVKHVLFQQNQIPPRGFLSD